MNKYRIKIAYDGSEYCGWQVQPNGRSIQSEIENVLKTILQEPIKISGSGRTDQGVHANGQVAHFETKKEFDLSKVCFAMNRMLPQDIQIRTLEKTDTNFHSRYSAKGKIYHYHFWTEPHIHPINARNRYHLSPNFDVKLFESALREFIGEKDYTTFSNIRVSHLGPIDAVREIWRLDMVAQEGGFRLEIEGNGFLYKMVRNIVGVLLEVGYQKRSIDSIQELFKAKDRRVIGVPAPAHALFLHEVLY